MFKTVGLQLIPFVFGPMSMVPFAAPVMAAPPDIPAAFHGVWEPAHASPEFTCDNNPAAPELEITKNNIHGYELWCDVNGVTIQNTNLVIVDSACQFAADEWEQTWLLSLVNGNLISKERVDSEEETSESDETVYFRCPWVLGF